MSRGAIFPCEGAWLKQSTLSKHPPKTDLQCIPPQTEVCDRLYAKKHVEQRFRGWWWTMSKERGEKDLERVQEYASSIQIQVTHLQSQASRREKQTGEEIKDLQTRVGGQEKKVAERARACSDYSS